MSTESRKQRRIGPFLLEDEIGAGGMGIVYRATYEKNGMKCAVKVLSPDLSADEAVNQRFIRETEILKKLRHPNIIRYYGAGSNRTQRFYAMELIEGGALDQLLRKQGRFTWEETVDYGMQVAKALEHAHNAGIVHRDLKPGNLLLTRDGLLKLSDFGIARDTQATALTQAGKTVGTMAYMAPEQISGKTPVTRRTDLYSLGCVLFEMLTGRTPFEAGNQAELLFKHLEEEPPSVRDFNVDVPIWLSRLIDEMLAKDPEDRPFDALAVQVRLEDIKKKVEQQERKLQESTQAGASALTQGYDAKTKALKKQRKKKKRQAAVPFYEQSWFLAIVLLVVLGGITAAVFRGRSEPSLYARAARYMETSEPGEWVHAEKDLHLLLERYPDGKHAEEARLWLDQIGMHRAERRIETNIRFGREPTSEAERLYVEAQQYEKFGDRFTALERYESIPKVIPAEEETRPYLNLARRQAEKIKAGLSGETDRTTFIREQLEDADRLYEEGKKLQAREKWQAILRLYGNSIEFEAFTSRARERLAETSS
jgi:eukaryotic-like serine/threonine-protein kinase